MTSTSFCGACGGVLKEGALYCGSCGAAAPQEQAATAVPPPTMVGTVGGSWASMNGQSADAGGPSAQAQTGVSANPLPADFSPAGSLSDPTIYATFGRRVGAYIIDVIPPILIYFVGSGALLAAVLRGSRATMSFSLVLFLGLPIAYFVLLWAMATKGSSPGKALLGVRVVRENTGAFPGAGLGLGRLLLMGLLIGITLYIGGFSPLWDSSGRRKGWWDRAAGTVVLNLSAVQGYRASVGSRSPGAASHMLTSNPPQALAPIVGDVATPSMSSTPSDVPEWDLPAVKAAAVPKKSPTASWSDRPFDQPLQSATPALQPPVAGGQPERQRTAGVIQDVPWGAVADSPPAGFITAIPGLTPVSGEESIEHTRMAPARAPKQDGSGGWELQLDDGRTVLLADGLIIGRDPTISVDESSAALLALGDEGRSVSKTHLRLDAGPAGVQVTDRHSTNGVTVITSGIPLACVPGVPTVVPKDSTVRFGDRHLLLRQR